MIRYLHIPKTAGTAMRNSIKGLQEPPFTMETKHTVTLLNTSAPEIGFVLRDPVSRFCSGFWECYRKPQTDRSYLDYERNIFKLCATPNDLMDHIRSDNNVFKMFTELRRIPPDGGLIKMLGSYTYWLGSINKYKALEPKVKLVLNTATLTKSLLDMYDISITTNTSKSRSHKQFNINQTYEVSPENREWFANTFRPEDYELMNYISQREYYE